MSTPSPSHFPTALGAGRWEEARLHKELRDISRGLGARLLSIEHDALAALRLYSSLGGLPIFGNARAGAWYVPPETDPPPAICSFKSADGHYGKWASSLRRPNAHVLGAAVAKGGVVIVDVTRSGKKWPDSLMKTVPIWCAVVNAVVGLSSCTCGKGDSDNEVCPDCVSLHLHPSVPDSERAQIMAQLPNWITAWRRAGAALHTVVPSFAAARERRMKPLRPLWVAPGRPLWSDGVPVEELEFTPIICVSASTPTPQGERAFVETRAEEEVVCHVTFPKRTTGFSYVQGAGDDEEGWCQGLTPELFWLYREEFMQIASGDDPSAGAADVEVKLKAMVEEVLRRALPCSPARSRAGTMSTIGIPIWKSRIRLAQISTTDLPKFAAAAGEQFGGLVILGSAPPVSETGERGEDHNSNTGNPNVKWVPMTDRRGKVEYKYAFGRALGPCLSLLRGCCVDKETEALVCCNGKSGDWSAGLAIAWLAWHCVSIADPSARDSDSDAEEVIDRVERMVYSVDEKRKDVVRRIPKEKIHATMLHFTSTYPQFQISRATLKQLNRFFSSPLPSSTVSEI